MRADFMSSEFVIATALYRYEVNVGVCLHCLVPSMLVPLAQGKSPMSDIKASLGACAHEPDPERDLKSIGRCTLVLLGVLTRIYQGIVACSGNGIADKSQQARPTPNGPGSSLKDANICNLFDLFYCIRSNSYPTQ